MNKTKLIALMLITTLLIIFSTTNIFAGAATTPITVLVNGKKVTSDVPPYIDKNSRTLVPIRFVAEAFGSQVDWNAEEQKVTIVRRDKTVILYINSNAYSVNDEAKKMDTIASITQGRTMVPIRFIAEAFGAVVNWDGKTKTVKITIDNGYVIPAQTELQIDIPPANDNPTRTDIDILIMTDRDMATQFADAYNILNSKFGSQNAKTIIDYAKKKTDRWAEVPRKTWTVNGQRIDVVSNGGSMSLQIVVWLAGVK